MVPRAFVIFPHSSEQYLDRFNQFQTKTVKDIRKKIPRSTLEEWLHDQQNHINPSTAFKKSTYKKLQEGGMFLIVQVSKNIHL